ncbi:32422_t:CDS:1, partial [Gigaspora margarita]
MGQQDKEIDKSLPILDLLYKRYPGVYLYYLCRVCNKEIEIQDHLAEYELYVDYWKKIEKKILNKKAEDKNATEDKKRK